MFSTTYFSGYMADRDLEKSIVIGESQQASSLKKKKSRTAGFFKTAVIVLVIFLAAAGVHFFLEREEPARKTNEIVFVKEDGSVPQVEEYIKKNVLHDPASFKAVHWTELRKTGELTGLTTYRVGVIYKNKNEKNEVVMDSKMIELDERGNILFVLDAGPINNR